MVKQNSIGGITMKSLGSKLNVAIIMISILIGIFIIRLLFIGEFFTPGIGEVTSASNNTLYIQAFNASSFHNIRRYKIKKSGRTVRITTYRVHVTQFTTKFVPTIGADMCTIPIKLTDDIDEVYIDGGLFHSHTLVWSKDEGILVE